jgi:large subunit ribosomal protein L10
LIASDDVIALANIPSREVLLAMVLGGIQSPISALLNVLQATIRDLVYVLKNLAEKKEEKGEGEDEDESAAVPVG